MKLFTKPLEEGSWTVYVTDDDYNTYTTIIDKDEPPSSSEVQELFKKSKENFRVAH